MHIDFLIVGQGLAGSILAEHLIQRGLNVKVLSDHSMSNSSLVAGGLYNPITGRKMVKTWNCDRLFEYLIPFYKELEKKLDAHFLYETPIYRPFFDIETQNEWMGKSSESPFQPYVKEIFTKPTYEEVNDDFGGLLLDRSGYLDTKRFVNVYKSYLQESGHLLEELFDHEVIEYKEEHIQYGSIKARGVVFCEGNLVSQNPQFSWLPFRPVKGELITIETAHTPQVIYNRGVFVIGKENGRCRVGATYDNGNVDLVATEKAKNQLIEKLNNLVNFDYQVVDQQVGIRPATKDRRPYIGRHPERENVIIFNGLGAKGVSLAPFYAKQLVAHLIDETKLDDEVNIERYFSLF